MICFSLSSRNENKEEQVSQWIVILFACEDSNINFQSDVPEDTQATFMSICLSLHIQYFAAPVFDNIWYKKFLIICIT